MPRADARRVLEPILCECYYGWLRRYQAAGLDGLKDRSSRPHHSPRVTQAEVIEKIVWLRKHYHVADGAIHFGRQLLQAAEDRTPVAAEHLASGQMPGGVLG